MVTQEFRTNRARFPHAELAAHKAEWVAFSADGTRIVVSNATYEGMEEQLEKMGVNAQNLVMEWVPGPDEDCSIGAEEWQ